MFNEFCLWPFLQPQLVKCKSQLEICIDAVNYYTCYSHATLTPMNMGFVCTTNLISDCSVITSCKKLLMTFLTSEISDDIFVVTWNPRPDGPSSLNQLKKNKYKNNTAPPSHICIFYLIRFHYLFNLNLQYCAKVLDSHFILVQTLL